MTHTAVVTGATSGIGLAAARELARRGMFVIGIGRDRTRCESARCDILQSCPDAKIEYILGDLSTTTEVRALAARVAELIKASGRNSLEVLMHVAGTVSSWHVNTSEAYELQFAVNHLAPFLLTNELLPLLRRSEDARVLAVSSESHYRTRIRWKDIMMHRHYSCLTAYKQSKLCNALFIFELARREDSISAYAIDPGLVSTDIGLKGTKGIERFVWKLRQKSGDPPETPAMYMVNIATMPRYVKKSGLYWKDGGEKKASRVARDEAEAKKLWDYSLKLCGIPCPERNEPQ